MSTSIQFVVLAKDRPAFLRDTLHSLSTQKGVRFSLRVSDNSDTGDVQDLLATEFPELDCVRRMPTLLASEHFSAVVSESSADYLVVFHDDDVVFPGFVKTLSDALDANPDVIAVAGNAKIIRDEGAAPGTTMGAVAFSRRLTGAESLARSYLDSTGYGVAAFPGYMYRRDALSPDMLNPDHGGKYADVSFLMKLAERGSILWLPHVVMGYRIHGGNDSGRESIPQIRKLLAYVVASTSIRRNSGLIGRYRYRYWLRWWRNRSVAMNRTTSGRERVVLRYLILYGVQVLLLRPDLCFRFFMRKR